MATLKLDIRDKVVLEVGAGIGDHTSFFLDRNCKVVSTEGRKENLDILQSRFPDIETIQVDFENPTIQFNTEFDIVYCYGLLYHLSKPAEAIDFLSRWCRGMLLLETCVSFGKDEAVNLCTEKSGRLSQSMSGQGCRPTRKWIFKQLKKHFEFVYMPTTQPNHEEFPIDWNGKPPGQELTRAIFIASRQPIQNTLLVEKIPMTQKRH